LTIFSATDNKSKQMVIKVGPDIIISHGVVATMCDANRIVNRGI